MTFQITIKWGTQDWRSRVHQVGQQGAVRPMEDFNISESQNQGRIQKGWLEQSPPPLKPIKVTLFTMILHNLKHNIRDTEPLFSLILSVETIL